MTDTAGHRIHQLVDDIARRLDEWRRHRDANKAEQAPEFTFFDFCDTSELGLSSILAWLLDPQEDHAQGPAFLEAFVADFGIPVPDTTPLARAKVKVEAVTDQIEAANRRIDIAITCGSFHIGIENKPYALFQPGQIVDYCRDLDRRSSGAFALVILKGWTGPAPDDQRPISADHDARVIDSDYRALRTWVRTCLDRCRAPKVRYFLEHFDRFIEEELLTGMSTKEEAIVVETVFVDRAQVLTALDVIAAASSVYERLHRDLVSSVLSQAKRGWVVTDNPASRERRQASNTFFLTIDFDPSLPVVFAFDLYDGGQHANVAIRRRIMKNPPLRRLNRIKMVLQSAFPGFERPSDTWPWWSDAESLADAELMAIGDQNIWKAAVEPVALGASIVAIAAKLEAVIRSSDKGDGKIRLA